MEHLKELIIVLSLIIPIVAIVMTFIADIKKKRRDTELLLTIIQQGIDAETAKVLTEKEPEDKYSGLRWGCILVGLGIGALCDVLLGLSRDNIFFWILIAAGIGIGLLVSFVIEYKLTKKEQQEKMKNEGCGE